MKYKFLILGLLSLQTVAGIDSRIQNIRGIRNFSLGENIDIGMPLVRKEKCIQYQDIKWSTNSEGVNSMKFHSQFANETETLTSQLNLDVSVFAKAKFGLFGGSINLSSNYEKYSKNYSDGLNYIVHAFFDFGEKEITSPSLYRKYQDLLDNGKNSEFISKCGTHFILKSNQVIDFNLIFSADHLTFQEKKILASEIKGTGQYGSFKSEITFGGKRFYEKASKFTEVQVNVESIGGDSSYLQFANSSTIDKIMTATNLFLSSAQQNKSAAKDYILVSMDTFGLNIPEYDKLKDQFFIKAYHKMLSYEAKILRLKKTIKKIEGKGRSNYETYYSKALTIISKEKDRLDNVVKNCILNNECDENNIKDYFFNIGWPHDPLKDFKLSLECEKGKNYNVATIIIEGTLNNRFKRKDLFFYKENKLGDKKFLRNDSLSMHEEKGLFYGVLEFIYEENFKSHSEKEHYILKINNSIGDEVEYNLGSLDVLKCQI